MKEIWTIPDKFQWIFMWHYFAVKVMIALIVVQLIFTICMLATYDIFFKFFARWNILIEIHSSSLKSCSMCIWKEIVFESFLHFQLPVCWQRCLLCNVFARLRGWRVKTAANFCSSSRSLSSLRWPQWAGRYTELQQLIYFIIFNNHKQIFYLQKWKISSICLFTISWKCLQK